MDNKIAVKAVLVTLGAAFVLLSVVEWKKLADLVPSDNGQFMYAPFGGADHPNSMVCMASVVAPGGVQPAGSSLSDCQKVVGSNVPWGQGIKAFVYSWIGVGLLVAAFLKPKGVSGGYW